MASVSLRPEERPASAYDPSSLMLAVHTEYEALRAQLRGPGDHDTRQIVHCARRCIRSLVRLERSARIAEVTVPRCQPAHSTVVPVPAPAPAQSASLNRPCRRRSTSCRRTRYRPVLSFLGLS